MLYDPERRWWPRAICREEDHELFFAEGGTPNKKPGPRVSVKWGQAKEICAMFPVMELCKRDTLGEEYGVFGGLDQYERHVARRKLAKAVPRWPEELRLAWGRELHQLRNAAFSWRDIMSRTGFPQAPAETLVSLYEEYIERTASQGNVIDLPLPGDERPEMPFPDRPGRRHAWVRHRGGISDGWYRGETPDGQWVNVTTHAGRGQVHKWVRAEDVHLYRPQAVVIMHFAGEPGRLDYCPQGHPYDEENTYRDPRGWRGCRICNRERGRERRAKEKKARRAPAS